MRPSLAHEAKIFIEPIVQLVNPRYWLGFQQARVKRKKNEGNNITSYTFSVNGCNSFVFDPGQNICLALEINGQRLERYFSISSPIQQLFQNKEITISVKHQYKGIVTTWMDQHLRTGNVVHIKNISGHFTLKNTSTPSLLIAAGSGITPFLSILESMPSEHLSHHKLIYSTRDTEPSFLERLGLLQKQGLNLVIHSSTKHGRLDQQRIYAQSPRDYEQSFLCGPAEFIQSMTVFLTNAGLSKSSIHCEHFHPLIDRSTTTNAAINWIGSSKTTTTSTSTGRNLLEEAEQAGRTPIYGCRAGICHQCSATKMRGVVKNLLTGELSDTGRQEIQLCICSAQSDLEIEIRERKTP